MKKYEHSSEHTEELRMLREKIYGNESIYNLREWYGWGIADYLETLVETVKDSDTVHGAMLQSGNDLATAARIIARFAKNGHETAAAELRNLLSTRFYLMEDEKFPEEWLQSFTLVILRPEKTVPLIMALKKDIWGMTCSIVRSKPEKYTDETKVLINCLPSLPKLLHDSEEFDSGSIVYVAYADEVLSCYQPMPVIRSFMDPWNKRDYSAVDYWRWGYHQVYPILKTLRPQIDWQAYGKMIPGLAFWAMGTREEVLTALGDSQGETVAAWEFRLPKFMTDFKPGVIGIGTFHSNVGREWDSPLGSINRQSINGVETKAILFENEGNCDAFALNYCLSY